MFKGFHHTEESKRKNSLSHLGNTCGFKKGKPSWNKGLKTGIVPKTAFKKGQISWNKGTKGLMPIPWNKGTKGMMPIPWNKGKKGMIGFWEGKRIPQISGANHYRWKGGVSSENEKLRTKFKETIQKRVLKRDNYTCQLCGIRGVVLHVDHIQSWAEYPDLRFCIDNCRTLCAECHYKITYGKPMSPSVRAWGYTPKEVSSHKTHIYRS